jgi:hypothetical protein
MNKLMLTRWIGLAVLAGVAGCSSNDDPYAGKHMDQGSGHRASMWKEHGTGRTYYYDENGAKVYVSPEDATAATPPSTRPGR